MISPTMIDVFPGDHRLDCAAFCSAGYPWVGLIAKCSQGTRYEYSSWLKDLMARFRTAAGDRYGVDLFDGFYTFLDLFAPGAPQIDYALHVIESACSEGTGELPLMLDVERGGQLHPTAISAQQVQDVTRSAAARYTELTGREATLYGGELLRASGVRDRLGCGRSAVALYGSRLGVGNKSTAEFLAETGTDLEHLMLWQYAAADTVDPAPPGYPVTAPGIGKVDISAVTLPGGVEALRALARPAP